MVLLSCMMCFYFFDILMTQSNTIYNLLYKNRLYNLYCIYNYIYSACYRDIMITLH
jgi:hypothetical protein